MRVKLPEVAASETAETLPRQVSKASSADIPRLVEIRSAVRENILSDPSRVTTGGLSMVYREFDHLDMGSGRTDF